MVMGMTSMAGTSNYQGGLLNAFEAFQGSCEGAQIGGHAAQQDHFKAQIVIQVHMGGGGDQGGVFMLQVGELLSEAVFVMIIHQGEGGCHRPSPFQPGLLGKLFMEQMADSLAPCRVRLAGTPGIETPQEFFLERHGKAGYLRHELSRSKEARANRPGIISSILPMRG